MALPDVVKITLEKMRNAVLYDPQVMLETWGGPMWKRDSYVFADLYGVEDELIGEFVQLRDVPAVYLTPIRERLQLTMATAEIYPSMRTAEYHLRSGWATAAVSTMYLPDWKHDDQFLVHLMYVRYKRRI